MPQGHGVAEHHRRGLAVALEAVAPARRPRSARHSRLRSVPVQQVQITGPIALAEQSQQQQDAMNPELGKAATNAKAASLHALPQQHGHPIRGHQADAASA